MLIVGGGEIDMMGSSEEELEHRGVNHHAAVEGASDNDLPNALAAALGDRQRSEGAIFETPRDNRENKAASKVQSSLMNIAGVLNIKKAMAAQNRKGGTAGSMLSPTGCQSMH